MTLNKLYQQVIMEHFKRPRFKQPVSEEEKTISASNPACGDQFDFHLEIEDGRISAIHFDGKGCAISTASCSLMAERAINASPEEIRKLIEQVQYLLEGHLDGMDEELGELVALKGVRRYPIRVKCASLAWDALAKALEELVPE